MAAVAHDDADVEPAQRAHVHDGQDLRLADAEAGGVGPLDPADDVARHVVRGEHVARLEVAVVAGGEAAREARGAGALQERGGERGDGEGALEAGGDVALGGVAVVKVGPRSARQARVGGEDAHRTGSAALFVREGTPALKKGGGQQGGNGLGTRAAALLVAQGIEAVGAGLDFPTRERAQGDAEGRGLGAHGAQGVDVAVSVGDVNGVGAQESLGAHGRVLGRVGDLGLADGVWGLGAEGGDLSGGLILESVARLAPRPALAQGSLVDAGLGNSQGNAQGARRNEAA